MIDLVINVLASRLNGKLPEEMRQIFRLPNDWRDEEEQRRALEDMLIKDD
jgi:hypothetical protein